jgi:hypothetical protein
MSDRVTQAWRDQATRSLDAMHERATKAEAERDELREQVAYLLEAMGWGTPKLKIGYSGQGGDIEDFEDTLHELTRLVKAALPTQPKDTP